MASRTDINLSRRERQIMDVIYQRGKATASEVMNNIPDPPSYSAVRALLRILEEKGHVRHQKQGPRYVYHPIVSPRTARQSALRRLLRTFFGGSAEQAMAALIELSQPDLTAESKDRLAKLIRQARSEGR